MSKLCWLVLKKQVAEMQVAKAVVTATPVLFTEIVKDDIAGSDLSNGGAKQAEQAQNSKTARKKRFYSGGLDIK